MGDKPKSTGLLCFSFLIFVLGFLLGLVLSEGYKLNGNINSHPFLREFDNISFGFIFMTNLWTILLLSFGGTLTLGGMSFLNLVINGMNLGTIFYEAWILNDVTTFFLLILPHGIFEIPALIIAGAAGFKIPYELLRFALGKKEEIITEEDAKEFFKLVGVSIALIFIAAVIEAEITLKLAVHMA